VDDFVLNVKQIAQYPRVAAARSNWTMLLQAGDVGAPYNSIEVSDFLYSALELGGYMRFAPQVGGLAWNGATFTWNAGVFAFSDAVWAPYINVGDPPEQVATQAYTDRQYAASRQNSVWSFNFRTGDIQLTTDDILRAGGAPIRDAHFGGWITVPTFWDPTRADDTAASMAWVQAAIKTALSTGLQGSIVTTFNTRTGDIVLTEADVSAALTAIGAQGQTTTAIAGDSSGRIANTLFVTSAVEEVQTWAAGMFETQAEVAALNYAPINSPNFTGVPTAPTAGLGTATGQLATTAYVQNAVAAATAGVASFNTRTGAVTLILADITGAGGAPLASPVFTGTPQVPTAVAGTNNTQAASTAFVLAQIAATGGGVTSFNTRTGAVVLNLADITGVGGAPLASPTFSGAPKAPTPAAADNSTTLATTAYVTNALALIGSGVSSFMGRTGAVALIANDISAAGGALNNSPALTGNPTSPTAAPGTNTTQIATTAFVAAAISAAPGVASFNSRSGVVVLTLADVTGVGGAPAASPTFSGIPVGPTAAPGTSSTQLATCAYVQNALTASGVVSSFNGRSGAVSLSTADITTAGGAPLASPAFTGTPTAPTPATATNTTQIATTAFVYAAIGASTALVQSFNSRTGAVTLLGADISAAGGALLASPAFTGTPTAPTASPASTNTTQIATCAFVQSAIATAGGVVTFNGRAGVVTLSGTDITGAGGALLASPGLTGTPTAPTATAGTNNTQIATTAFVTAAVAGSVLTFNSRSGNVTLQNTDISGAGGALLSSPAFTGTPTAPTAAPGTSTTQLATTAFVQAALPAASSATPLMDGTAAVGTGTTWARADHVHPTDTSRAPLASPTFTGVPAGPTAALNTNTTQLATTAFVMAQLPAAGVTTFNGRSGAVTLLTADVTGAGGAPIASPTFTGTPAGPTAAANTNTTQLATTAFVMAQLAAGAVTSFNTRTGAVTLNAADVKSSGALLFVAATITRGAAVAVSTTTPASGIINTSAAHGMSTGMSAQITATAPTGLTANQCYYVRVTSTTQLYFHNTLADARAAANTVTWSGAGTSWNVCPMTLSGLNTAGLDATFPVGQKSAVGTIQLDINLATPVSSTSIVPVVLWGGVNNMYNSNATPAVTNSWAPVGMPTWLNTSLLQFLTANWAHDSSNNGVGTYASQGTTAFTVAFAFHW
jgi:hypothetical protein